jgi:hypothetical protein
VLILAIALLLLLLLAPDIIWLSSLERSDEGGEGPLGAVSIWSWSSLLFGHPLDLVLYIPFRIFAYSSNILKANFDLMDSMSSWDLEVG